MFRFGIINCKFSADNEHNFYDIIQLSLKTGRRVIN